MIGSTLGHYRVVQLLGQGGMGEVYLAEDLRLQRQVALKMLARELAHDPDRRERFEREARAVAALNHPNIVTIHAVEEVDERLFLALELVDGQTLQAHIPDAGLPLDRLLAYAIPLTDAVGTAHQRGITHRDLKPANVMVTTDGRVKVLDFGLAKLKEDALSAPATMPTAELTGEGRILGTAAYMSPEQAEGKPVDARSDVFSLGVMLYEMSTGERPFKGETQVSLISSIIKDTPSSITTLKRDVPREFARIVQRCLEKDPEDRYQTAKDLRNDLRAFKQDLESGELQPLSPGSSAATTKSSTTRQILIVGGAILFAVLVAALGLSMWLRRETGATPGGAAGPFQNVGLTRLTTTGSAGSAAISQDGKYVAYVVSQEGKSSLWLRQVPTASSTQIIAPAAVRYSGVSFSPDSNYVYFTTSTEGQEFPSLYQMPILGGGARRVLEHISGGLTFSPDRSRFAFIRNNFATRETMVMIADVQGGNIRPLVTRKAQTGPFSGLSWSPDGKSIAASGYPDVTPRGEIVLIDPDTGRESGLRQTPWRFVSSVAWMPDGKALLINAQESSGDGVSQIWLLPYPTGEPRRVTSDLNGYTGVSLASDGRTLVTVRNDRRARVWVVPTADESKAQSIAVGAGVDDGIMGIAWTPDGRILYSSTSAGSADIWMMNADGRNRVQLTNVPGDETSPQMSADGKTIIFMVERDTGRELWHMDSDGVGQKRLGEQTVSTRASISADGKWAYYTQSRTGVNLQIATADGKAVPLIEDEVEAKKLPERVHEVVPSPDGKLMAGHYLDKEQNAERIVVFSASGPVNAKLFPGVSIPVQWSADGESLLYSLQRDGVWNMWRQPLAGGSASQLTHFKSERIFSWSLAPDQRRWALVRGDVTSDVVMVSQR